MNTNWQIKWLIYKENTERRKFILKAAAWKRGGEDVTGAQHQEPAGVSFFDSSHETTGKKLIKKTFFKSSIPKTG